MLQLIVRSESNGMDRLRWLLAAATVVASTAAAPVLAAQRAHEPLLRRDLPPTAWYYDGRDDHRDFPTNGFFPGDFAANPPGAWLGAAGIFGSTPSGGSQFGPIYCTRPYRARSPQRGHFQRNDGVWYRCRK
jgi:hypothetical protein